MSWAATRPERAMMKKVVGFMVKWKVEMRLTSKV